MEMKDRKNGKLPPSHVSRSTQTLTHSTSGKAVISPTIKNIGLTESFGSVKSLNNTTKFGNAPFNKNDVSL